MGPADARCSLNIVYACTISELCTGESCAMYIVHNQVLNLLNGACKWGKAIRTMALAYEHGVVCSIAVFITVVGRLLCGRWLANDPAHLRIDGVTSIDIAQSSCLRYSCCQPLPLVSGSSRIIPWALGGMGYACSRDGSCFRGWGTAQVFRWPSGAAQNSGMLPDCGYQIGQYASRTPWRKTCLRMLAASTATAIVV